MSQNSLFNPTSGLPGLTFINNVNKANDSLSRLLSGANAPTASGLGLADLAGVVWHDTTNKALKVRDQADSAWITLGTFDETNKLWIPAAPAGLAVGTTLAAWNSGVKAVDLAAAGAVAGGAGGTALYANLYQAPDAKYYYKITSSSAAGMVSVDGNGLTLKTAPAGTAGAVATLTQVMNVDLAGNVTHAGLITASGGIKFPDGGSFTASGNALVGNLGLGTTPSAWSGGGRGINLSTQGVLYGDGGSLSLGYGAYYNGTNWVYTVAGFAPVISDWSILGWRVISAAAGTAGNTATMSVLARVDTSGNMTVKGNYLPTADNAQNVGSASLRMGTIYAGTGTINTSDAATKTLRGDGSFSDAEKRVAARLKALVKVYQFNDALAEKGADKARLHVGLIAQEVQAAFTAEGLDAARYGLWCEDTLDEDYQETETVERQKTEAVTVSVENIVVTNGVATLTPQTVTRQQPVFETLPLVDAAGNPVLGPDGQPRSYQNPVMETITQTVTKTRPGTTTRLGLRYEELLAFVIGAGL